MNWYKKAQEIVERTDTLYQKGGIRPPDFPVGTKRKGTDNLLDELVYVPLNKIDYTEGNNFYAQTINKYINEPGLPPVLILKDNGRYSINDGHHRIEAAKRQGLEGINAWVRK